MTRPLHIRLIFTVCLAVLLTAMAGVSLTTLRLDRSQRESERQAGIEENVRLALWRMDSILTSIMVEESARPFSAWESFSRSEPMFTKGYSPIQPGEVLTPSPLLAYASSNVLLHFQLSPEGQLTSPQVPRGGEQAPALNNGTTLDRIHTAAARLNQYQALLNDKCPAPMTAFDTPGFTGATSMLNRDLLIVSCAVFRTNTVGPITVPEAVVAQNEAQLAQQLPQQKGLAAGGQPRNSAQFQEFRNSAEWSARSTFNQAAQNQGGLRSGQKINAGPYDLPPPLQQVTPARSQSTSSMPAVPRPNAVQQPAIASGTSAAPTPPVSDFVGEGIFKPLWLGSELVLARRVNFANRFVVQGVWLNWTNLKQSLAASVADLFPSVELVPVLTVNPDPGARMLAAIPARLLTGPACLPSLPAWSPIRTALVVAWLCALLAALAVAVLLHGTVSLSERRAAFVSAVTHELRTPLTTFKMYSEMLAEGMVPDETKRKSYLATLCSEANRLSHLVENVLAYARLERGSARSRVERVALGQLIERVKPRLDQRAAQAGLNVVVDSCDSALDTVVHVDASAVEQILFNLVDNACKYAGPTATEKLIHLEALPDGKFAMLRVRDHGQGISAEGAKRLFQPFSKSAREAAHTAPGVGLGLALCRRLSRSMGGDLRLDPVVKAGACFVLTLPISQAGGLTPREATIG